MTCASILTPDVAVLVGLLYRNVGHEPARSGAVRVVLAGLEEDAVAGTDHFDRFAFALAEADAIGDPDRLSVRVGVPGGAGAGVKWTAAAPIRQSSEGAVIEARKANRAFVDLLTQIAERKNATPAQIALAWLLAQKPWIAPIPGTTKPHRLDENIAAADVELTPDDLREIESAQIEAQGARYSEANQQMIDR